jgi:hypothetical protein
MAGGAWRCATNQMVASSNPDEVVGTTALGLTRTVVEMCPGSPPGGGG